MLDHSKLDAIVTAVCEQLEGEWLIVGGAIAALWFAPRRTTEDVDIMGLGGAASERYVPPPADDEVRTRRAELRRLAAG